MQMEHNGGDINTLQYLNNFIDNDIAIHLKLEHM